MKPIPKTENALVLRTDFSNTAAWEEIWRLIQKQVGLFRFRANVDFLDFEDFSGAVDEYCVFLGFRPF